MTSIFLSHNSQDKYFVRKLKEDLKRDGVVVWFDEDEMKVGDSLIEKISEGISNMEYLGAILSKNSVESEWVKKEDAIAMTAEISGKRVKVLPVLLEECNIPVFLEDKIYADFRGVYIEGYKALLRVLAPDKNMFPEFDESAIDGIISSGVDIYNIEELKEVLNNQNSLGFKECEKLIRSLKLFENNQTVILEYVSNMSLSVAESLKGHNYHFDDLCKVYFKHLDNLLSGRFPFGFLDTLSDFLRIILLKVIEDPQLRKKILIKIRAMGIDYNRWYVMGSFENIVAKIANKIDVRIIFEILKDAPLEEICRYLSSSKTDLSIKVLTALKTLKTREDGNL